MKTLENRFRGTKDEVPENVLDERPAEPGELSGVLNKVLRWIPRIREKGIGAPKSVQRASVAFRQATDPMAAWLDAKTVSGTDCQVVWRKLYDAYRPPAPEAWAWPREVLNRTLHPAHPLALLAV